MAVKELLKFSIMCKRMHRQNLTNLRTQLTCVVLNLSSIHDLTEKQIEMKRNYTRSVMCNSQQQLQTSGFVKSGIARCQQPTILKNLVQ